MEIDKKTIIELLGTINDHTEKIRNLQSLTEWHEEAITKYAQDIECIKQDIKNIRHGVGLMRELFDKTRKELNEKVAHMENVLDEVTSMLNLS